MKKQLMKYIWRFQAVMGVSGIFFWSMTLTLLADKYTASTIGIEGTLLRLTVTFLIVLGILISVGLVYDRILRLWNEQQIVAAERNPYAIDCFTVKEARTHRLVSIPMQRKLGLDKEADEFEAWLKEGTR